MRKHLEKKFVKGNTAKKKMVQVTMTCAVSMVSLLMFGCGNATNATNDNNNSSQAVTEVVADNNEGIINETVINEENEIATQNTDVTETDVETDAETDVENADTKETNEKDKDAKKPSDKDKKHKEPPVIYGVEDKTYHVGEKASYMSDIYALDDEEKQVDVEVDKSQVDTSTPGSYTVYYKAVDSDGNETSKEALFSFVEDEEPSQAEDYSSLNEVVSAVLSQITNESMSMGEKARAVFNYAHGKIGYSVSNYDGYDWENEAYLALKDIEKNGYIGGDCFTFCSVDLALLNGIGADCIWVDNSGATTGDHSWLLCNVGSGWYHFDSTRMYDKFECFMLTDEQVQDYINRGNSIYRRDLSAYPATPDEPFVY